MATKRFVSKDNLGRVWTRLFGKVLNSKEEIEANKSENMIAGADAVKEVYSSLNWKLIGTATGTQSIAVDSTKYNELNVIVCTGAHACYSFSIPFIYLDETIFNFVNGYFAYDNYMGMITLSADKTKIMLESVWQGGQNIANTCITKVYAR